MKVKDRMSPNVVTIFLDASISDAFRLMKEKNIRRLPVMEKERLIGIITLSDLNRAAPSQATSLSIFELNYLLAKTKVKDVFSHEQKLHTVGPEDYIEVAAKLMLAHQVSGLPVVEGDRLVGIITETDLFRALIDIMGVKRPHTRIDALIADGPGGLAELTSIMAAREINIINTVMYYEPALDKYKIQLRIEELNYEPVVEELKDKNYEIESVIANPESD